MQPRGYALAHPAAPLLQTYADEGCPVDTGPNWDMRHILTALKRGPHISAYQEGAVEFLRAETMEKIKNGYARVVKWGEIKDSLPPNFKLSPVAMVPHKSKAFRCIMDLSFRLRRPDGGFYESVNSATTRLAPPEAMTQLGNAVQRIIATMADNFDPGKPFYFTKLDIKDGFWRMAVNDDDAWSFCYVLPSRNEDIADDDIEIVVPNSLQMGWAESPPYFCAGSETARDLIELLLPHADDLPSHPLESKMLEDVANSDMSISSDKVFNDDEISDMDTGSTYTRDRDDYQHTDDMEVEMVDVPIPKEISTPKLTLFEVFVDDFIGATNDHSLHHLRNTSRAMLHAIHSIFPPPEVTGHPGGDSISIKKIDKGEGKWGPSAEILGWEFDGDTYCIHLPLPKRQKIDVQLRNYACKKAVKLNDWQKLAGRLQHASMVMPGGWGLFSPVQMAMASSPPYVAITIFLKHALKDWRTIIRQIEKNPTHVLQLVDGLPNFLGSSDSCRRGTGGVWFGTDIFIGFWVWRIEFPADIIAGLVTAENPNGWVTMNDLELAGVVLELLALEVIVPNLVFKHAGMNCDNSTAVSWASKYRTSKSLIAAILLRFLCVRMHRRRAAPAITIGISGDDNGMADVASRSFKMGNAFRTHDANSMSLSDYCNTHYPLPQPHSWKELVIPSELVSRVISCVRGETLTMGSLLRLPKLDRNTGSTGAHTFESSISETSFSKLRPNLNASSWSLPLLKGSGMVTMAEDEESRFRQFLTRSRPSASATIELVGQRSPIKKEGTKDFILPIMRLLEGMRRNDPLPVPQLAVPVAVVEEMYRAAYCGGSSAREQAKADLAIIAFYYLLRVGEYTKPRKVFHNGRLKRATRTRQFRLKDIGFFHGDELIDMWNIPKEEVRATLLHATSATLKITNQKNGRMGQTIHHEAIPDIDDGPTQALARRVSHIIEHGGTVNTLLCDVFDVSSNTWDSVTQKEIVDFVRLAVKNLNLHKKGIDPDLVGAHSLRAGGAMAMKLHGEDDTLIMKQGRWTSLTFVMYIHNQIAHLTSGLSRKMNTPLPYLNIGNIQSRQ